MELKGIKSPDRLKRARVQNGDERVKKIERKGEEMELPSCVVSDREGPRIAAGSMNFNLNWAQVRLRSSWDQPLKIEFARDI